jgi:hypothetical protein
MNHILASLKIDDELFWKPMRVAPPDPWVGHIPSASGLTTASVRSERVPTESNSRPMLADDALRWIRPSWKPTA